MVSKSVLLLDDEYDSLSVFRKSIQASGYEVLAVTDPVQALNYFTNHSNRFGLIISDIRMPKMDGIAFARNVREIAGGIKIVLMTAFEVSDIEASELARLKVDELLQKPIVPTQLIQIVTRYLDDTEMLDRVYCCKKCRAILLFRSDIREHERTTKHREWRHILLQEE